MSILEISLKEWFLCRYDKVKLFLVINVRVIVIFFFSKVLLLEWKITPKIFLPKVPLVAWKIFLVTWKNCQTNRIIVQSYSYANNNTFGDSKLVTKQAHTWLEYEKPQAQSVLVFDCWWFLLWLLLNFPINKKEWITLNSKP